MDISKEPIPFLSPIILDFSDRDEERKKYKEENHIMGMCYNNGRNSSLLNNSLASIDSTNKQMPRHPPPANPLLGSALISPQTPELDPTIPRFRLPTSAAAEAFLSAATTDLLHLRRRPMRSLSSSRGSSPSPLSPIENLETPPWRSPPGFKPVTPTQTKIVGEEVLVMDGILVDAPSAVGGNRAVARPSLDSSGMASSNVLFKTEICRSWVETGTCRYGSKCQFAHGKEELRPARPPKIKPEICRSFATMGTCTIGQKSRYSHPEAAKPATKTTRQMKEMGMEKMEAAPVTEAEEMVAAALGGSLRDAEAYINQVLYGSTRRRRRLPVFAEICPQ